MDGTIAGDAGKRNHGTYRLGEAAAAADLDRYMAVATVPFLSAQGRSRLLALILLHNELRRVRPLVREPFPGLIRLQWWRDQLSSNEPGVPEFLTCLRSSGLADEIAGLVDPFADALEQRAVDAASGPDAAHVRASAMLQRCSARILGETRAELLDRASAVGAAYALSLGENPDDKVAARHRLAFARSGPPPPRGVMPAFALAHVAGFRLRAGRVARPPLTMPFRLFLCTLARRI
ncbi:MAG: hypothetical protein R3C70_15760 [Geminicoccaceae bacterium]